MSETESFENLLERNVKVEKSIVGLVNMISEKCILVGSKMGALYNIPKQHIKYVRTEIVLDMSVSDLQKYRVR